MWRAMPNSESNCRRRRFRRTFRKIKMKFLCSGEQMRPTDKNFKASGAESAAMSASAADGENVKTQLDNGNIEEAELSLRETSSLNYEEARALLGRIEYQKGNIEAALRVFEGIDINGITSKMKITLKTREERHRRHSKNFAVPPPMSIHAVSLLFEAIFLKAKCLQRLDRFEEAAQSCRVILDIVESSFPEGLPENVAAGDSKLPETLTKAVELLPELWKLADSPREAILSYRRALLSHWRLNPETMARIQKEFAVYLLYSGEEAVPPNLRAQAEGSFIPRNNIEEAILLLIILLRKVNLKRIIWDATILDHLSFALSMAGDLTSLAKQIEELIPAILDRKELYYTLSLCYYGAGEGLVALSLLKKLLLEREEPNYVPGLLMASRICGESPSLTEDGIEYALRASRKLENGCESLERTASFVLGIALSGSSRTVLTESERVVRQSKALQALEASDKTDPKVLYWLALENAEQRKLDAALRYAKQALKLGAGSDLEGWMLLARVLSAQKRFTDADTIVAAALDQIGKWEQGKLLRLKAKLCLAQGQVKSAIETYTQLLALLQVQSKSFSSAKKLQKGYAESLRSLEMETWHDLAHVYINLSQWQDAEACLSRSMSISPFSSARCHAQGVLYRKQGLVEKSLTAFMTALGIDPMNVPSLVSMAEILQEGENESNMAVVRSFLMEALRLERMNSSAWYSLGKLYKAEGSVSSLQEAADCFQAAALIEESAPVEPFR
ncbi:PREDICTED: tetratricopeptide repeat protein 7A [Tarenaya hassleriana]|uniref:tetratricopeptide repeat protein 7A n=1 Tax=Tarenaya hassleriana TaxID=28532 RepID=UPI00053C15C7|nr:PREDICTED: tetratricopeptide repeat protein 7A [Tarenaya hassleriana]XP_010540908.1 PREDICTED: tetratricopeptide repeat protein 7A [Tarenaya hassleriana]XP_010540910.1 PREDICTED: tetratricopeptide repeat protein 7A [Tarenaya hassleriana]XP_010540911.1 PREDICTED: tetratricopeptide repeat protein 7A [Tarenaya hassleriana]